MAKIPEKMRWIYDLLLTAAILAMATVLCTLLRRIDDGSGYVNLIFVLAVATISRWTEGYFWGIFSAVSGVLFVNYVFTYPYWEFNFTITGYPLTFVTMFAVSIVVGMLTDQVKRQERVKSEAEKEKMKANLLRSVSHDLRTPLTSIIGSTSAMIENPDLPEGDRLLLLTDVRDDAQWLIRVVENLLSITRMGDTTTRLVKNPEPAEEILGAVTAKFRKRYPDVRIRVSVPEDLLFVPMDAVLEGVTMNLDIILNVLRQGSEIDAAREQWSDGSNTLAIAPGEVVVYSRNYVTNRSLEEAGVRIHTIPSAELSRGRGGPRCMSMPLWREDP